MIFNPVRYAITFLVTLICAAVAIWGLRSLLGVDFSSSFLPVVPAMVAAMLEGNNYARSTSAPMDKKQAWKAAFVMTAIAIGFNLVLGLVIFVAVPNLVFASGASGILLGFLALYCVIWLLANRFFFGMGVRNERSSQARKTRVK